jgi:hypothetical protein
MSNEVWRVVPYLQDLDQLDVLVNASAIHGLNTANGDHIWPGSVSLKPLGQDGTLDHTPIGDIAVPFTPSLKLFDGPLRARLAFEERYDSVGRDEEGR